MSERQFFEASARTTVRDAIIAVEAETSAELVVTVRQKSASYPQVELIMGCVFALVTLAMHLFLPAYFAVHWVLIEVVVAFFAGALFSAYVWSPARWLVRKRAQRAAAWQAACTMFHEKRLTCTSARNAVLVFVSLLERDVVVVVDVGIDPETLGPGWKQTLDKLNCAVRLLDFTSFAKALVELGPVLGAAMPRAEDDINELPDDPDMP